MVTCQAVSHTNYVLGPCALLLAAACGGGEKKVEEKPSEPEPVVVPAEPPPAAPKGLTIVDVLPRASYEQRLLPGSLPLLSTDIERDAGRLLPHKDPGGVAAELGPWLDRVQQNARKLHLDSAE